MAHSIELREYVTAGGKYPVRDYLRRLHDSRAQTRIAMPMNRLATGNFGDSKFVRDGVFELRIDYGPGYRVYFGVLESTCVLLLCAGDKRTQQSDIDRAAGYLRDYKRRSITP
jgi:putative addiction module killer protein